MCRAYIYIVKYLEQGAHGMQTVNNALAVLWPPAFECLCAGCVCTSQVTSFTTKVVYVYTLYRSKAIMIMWEYVQKICGG